MTEQSHPADANHAGPADTASAGPAGSGPVEPAARPAGFWQRRRDRFVAEIDRNRQGGHRIPTWVLSAAVLAMLAAWAAVILLS